jgi:hypothetical protein
MRTAPRVAALTAFIIVAACAGGTLRPPTPQAPVASVLARPSKVEHESAARCTFHKFVPPLCSAKGAFHRFYTTPGASYIFAEWVPTSNTATLPTPIPTSNPSPVPATGLLYVQGWPTSALGGASTQAGYRYDPANNWFVPFLKAAGKKVWYSSLHFAVAQLSVSLYAGTSCTNASATCAVAAFSGTCAGTNTSCTAGRTVSTPGWLAQACCVLASAIAIDEPAPGRDFSNGYIFGPIDQVVCASAAAESSGCKAPGLIYAGQRHPSDASKIVVQDRVPGLIGAEVDTIDLHP